MTASTGVTSTALDPHLCAEAHLKGDCDTDRVLLDAVFSATRTSLNPHKGTLP
jgi:hypothetical protein